MQKGLRIITLQGAIKKSSHGYQPKIYAWKKRKKRTNDFFIAVLLLFYDLNSTKSRLSNQKSGKKPEVTLIQNLKKLHCHQI